MKAPVRATHRIPSPTKKKTRAYSALMYRTHKEVSPVAMRSPNLLANKFCFPRPVLLRLVSAEASRLSRTNRLKVITKQEVNMAVALLYNKIRTKAAA